MLRKLLVVPVFAFLALAACGLTGSDELAAAEAELSGTVLERIDAPPYSYLRLAVPDGELWAAVPQSAVVVGARVTIRDAKSFTDFHSRALGRRFDRIVFGHLAGTPPGPAAKARKVFEGALGGALAPDRVASR
jgi:hypothetical protein